MQKLLWIEDKILSAEILIQRCSGWRAAGSQIVFTNGCFDILHRGHLDYLARAASLGNKLIVGVNTDGSVKKLKGSGRPINNELDRAFALASLLLVDAVCLFEEETPLKLIEECRPNILAKGGDYTPDTVIGADFVRSLGGTVEIIPFVTGYSTTGIIEKIHAL